MTSRHTSFTIAFSAILVAAATSLAGPLDPPAGPITSTAKPLSEVEPRIVINATNTPGDADSLFRITQPGSYYLTGNVTGVVGKHGIEIDSSNITIDLMGFDLAGVPGSFIGVTANAVALTNLTVRNGSVRNWGGGGVVIGGSNFGGRLEGLHASGNLGDGLAAPNGSTIVNCSAYSNTGYGIRSFAGSTFDNCQARTNTGNGFGFNVSCTFNNCAAVGNTLNGFDSTFRGNSVFSGCLAGANAGHGIDCSDGCTITECAFTENGLDGIRCGASAIIRANNCFDNGAVGSGAGIHATGSDNHIEGNNCTGADRGIDVDAAGNIIVRNTCSGNTTNWDIVANNYYGPIIDRTGIATAAAVGSAAASTLATTDANANFSY